MKLIRSKQFNVKLFDTSVFEDFEPFKIAEGRAYKSKSNPDLIYPSVTTVLQEMKSDKDKRALQNWKKRVGETAAKKESTRASNRGTKLHKICERYLLNEEIELSDELPTTIALFKQLQPVFDSHVDDIVAVETKLISHKIKLAGSTDLIASYKGKPAVIDSKSSTKFKRKEWIENYFLQASLYAYMFWEMTDIPVTKLVIAIANESSPKPTIYEENTKNYLDLAVEKVKYFHKKMDARGNSLTLID